MNHYPPEVLARFRKIEIGEIAISSITVSELHYGIQKSRKIKQNTERLKEFMYPFDVLSYDEAAAQEYGKIRMQLEKKGRVIDSLDMLIAAHAKSRQLILITNNVKEFKKVPSLKVENWVAK
jgi:tRNA(fMet)-specific endonuclease VapC